MFRDIVRIRVQSGNGGRGSVSFRREKYVPFGGPDGGDGGDGGSVRIVCDRAINHLGDFRDNQLFKAEHGNPGESNKRHGRNGGDVEVPVPPGTLVYDADTDEQLADLGQPGEKLVPVVGGIGGRGNARFATPTRQAPRHAQPGLPGEEKNLRFELKLIAAIGLVGRPNAGKTTLLRTLTGSKGKVAPYPFTTISPNLGVLDLGEYERAVMADVPGLIEGAHRGEGLGLTFLRHIERTQALVVMVDAATLEGEPIDHYREVCRELEAYESELLERPRILVANKVDLDPDAERLAVLRATAEEEGIDYAEVSAMDDQGLGPVVEWIRARGREAAEVS
ncbi:MAG: GTPase ObgE [Acidobacteria bacterium]|nr:GTPase ObgE [Acidobacteriota bacterium]